MAFLNPLFFLGALAVAVPVLLHLIKRENARKIEFPSLMFLRRIHKRTIRYQKLRHLLLLLLRVLAFVFIILAFMRPYREEAPAAASMIGRTTAAHIIAIDNSMSMGYQDRWIRAKRAAEDIVRQSDPGDKFAVLEFSDKTVVRTPLTTDSSVVLKEIEDSADPCDRATRYAQALRAAERVAQDAGTGRRIIHVISDFQKSGLAADEMTYQLGAGIELEYVDLGSDDFSNLAIQNVHVADAGQRSASGLSMNASVAAFGTRDRENVPVGLTVDGRRILEKRIHVAKGSEETVGFEVPNLQPGIHLATLEIDDPSFTRDNRFYMTVDVSEKTPVLVVERQDTGKESSSGFFLARALNVDAVSPYKLTEASPQNPAISGRLLIWNDASSGGSAVQKQVMDFVKRGGGLVIVLGDSTQTSDFNRGFGSWLPVKMDETSTSEGRPGSRPAEEFALMTDIRMDHPIFEPFGKPHSGTFSTAKFYRHAKVVTDSGAEVLARFDNGDPALVSIKIDMGRVLLFTSSADLSCNDLPLKAVYAPFWQQMLRYLGSFKEEKHWMTVGDVLLPKSLLLNKDLSQADTTDSSEAVVILDPMKQRLNTEPGSEGVVAEKAGFYEIRTESSSASAAVNTLPEESDLTHFGAEEVTAGWISSSPATFSREEPPNPEEQGRHQRIWGFLLLASLLFLISESLLSSGGRQSTPDEIVNRQTSIVNRQL